MNGLCPYKTVKEIWNIIEILGEEKIKSTGALSIDVGVCQPIAPTAVGRVIVLEIITVGETDLEKRQ